MAARGAPLWRRKRKFVQDVLPLQREAAELRKRVAAEAPPKGSDPLGQDELIGRASEWQGQATRFDELPLSQATLKGLAASNYETLTEIQRAAIPHALAGRDILGAARTGSGKTLAFLVPLVEALFRATWSHADGTGAIVIAPTRELCVQIFQVLRNVGRHHKFSAALVIGGKSVEEEREHIAGMNIVVATPGRLLHHLEQTPNFTCDRLQLLVLDEADLILDMGFASTVDAILKALPTERQTMLFSATPEKRVRNLARVSLREPEYVSTDEVHGVVTPKSLAQHYMVVEAQNKINTLYSFVKTHLKSKMLAFFNSCKQVRFIYETFRRLHPGVLVLALYGKQKQERRLAMYNSFVSNSACLLLATDIAARGLDFPQVDWVVQVDAPEGVNEYVHRVGRTARYRSGGNALLFLLPSELLFLERLSARGVKPARVVSNVKQLRSITEHLKSFLVADADLKYLGQKAFVSYVRSIHLRSDKQVFRADELPFKELAESMGLPGEPRVKFLKGAAAASKHKLKNIPYAAQNAIMQGSKKPKEKLSEAERLAKRVNASVFAESRERLRAKSDDEEEGEEKEDGDGILRPTTAHSDAAAGFSEEDLNKMSRRQRAEIRRARLEAQTRAKAGAAKSQQTDNVDEAAPADLSPEQLAELQQRRYAALAARLKSSEPEDKMRERKRVRALHRKQKKLLKLEANGGDAADLEEEDDEEEEDQGDGERLPMRRRRRAAAEAQEEEEEGDDEDVRAPRKRARLADVDVREAEAAALRLLSQRSSH